MTGRRQRDTVAPSLFPFLAVLLCTIGALVLILMLIVATAQASAQKVVQTQVEENELLESQVELVHYATEDRLAVGRIDLEKKRLQLQHVENHIQELLDELAELKSTAELLDAESKEASPEEEFAKLTELEKQLAEAEAEALKKLEKPAGDKPIFAIIPYDGPNGTHRRPIYLECRQDGVFIQPEGIQLTEEDLKPPYGPGNPLDAALRTIRSEYVPQNQAVTSTAYPLLVVRPSGVLTYAMARAAMSGWDDQFGYELVDEELELAFPPSKPGLKARLATALDLARQRQAALVMAMPGKYRPDASLRGGGDSQNGYSNSSYGGGGYAGGNYAASGGSANSGYGDSGSYAQGADAASSPSGGPTNGPGRGGVAFDASDPAHPLNQAVQHGSVDQILGFGSGGGSPNADSGGIVSEAAALRDGELGSGQFGGGGQAGGAWGETQLGGELLAGGQANSGDNPNAQAGSSGSGPGGSAASGGTSASGQASGSAGSNSALGGSQSPASGSQIAIPSFGMQGYSQPGQNQAGGGQSGGGQAGSRSGQQAGSSGGSRSAGGSQSGGSSQAGDSAPVAASRGRNWAWSDSRRTQTPVVRSIRLRCNADSWILLEDSFGGKQQIVTFDNTPVQRAEQLAKLIRTRVDGWGIALEGGYWKPTLVVEIGPDAEWRYEQLVRLFEASGLDIQPETARPTPSGR